MFCKKCGTEIPETKNHCRKCGVERFSPSQTLIIKNRRIPIWFIIALIIVVISIIQTKQVGTSIIS